MGSALHPLEQQMKWNSRLLHYRGLLSLFPTAFHTAQSLSKPRLIAIMTFSHHNNPDISLIGIHSQRTPINRPHLSPAPSEQRVLACALRQIVSQLQLYHIILLSSFTGIEKIIISLYCLCSGSTDNGPAIHELFIIGFGFETSG